MNNAKKSIFYIVLIIFFISCKDGKYPSDSTPIFQTFPSKTYVRDNTTGNMISTEIDTADFHASDNCIACHPNHVADWNRSMQKIMVIYNSGFTLTEQTHIILTVGCLII